MTTTTETHVVIGNGSWGSGDTLAEAKANFRRHHGRLSDGYVALTFDADTEFVGVDQMGYVHWKGNAPAEAHHPARGRKDLARGRK